MSWVSGVLLYVLAAAFVVAMASDVKLDMSMRIARQGAIAKVAVAAEVSVDAVEPCAEDEYQSTVGICMHGGPNGELMGTLFQDVRSEQNIFSAWRHVKKSALNSNNGDIRGKASEFEHAHQKHLRRIITQLREGRFTFGPVEGVLKDKKKREAQRKKPRPIAISTITSRVVQRAILQTLQPRKARNLRDADTRFETTNDPRLGKINDVNQSEFGVGGLIYPYGGVRPAIQKIMGAINGGAKYFYQSDIKEFFTKIPTGHIVDFVQRETGDHDLSSLFSEALDVHLENSDELKGYADLFPSGGIGVAQGSSLSSFAGNVLLYDMDHELNKMGVTAVRYIDDILMVSERKDNLRNAIEYAEKVLSNFGFGLYWPGDGSGKAAKGNCVNAINFLGCTIQPNRCVPSKASVDKIKEGVALSLSDSKAAINEAIGSGKSLDLKMSQSAVLKKVGDRVYGWQKSFEFCNSAQSFEGFDRSMEKLIGGYQEFIFRKLRGATPREKMMILGIPSTKAMFLKSEAKKNKISS